VFRRQLVELRRAGEDSLVVLVVSDSVRFPEPSPHRGMVRDLLRSAERDGWPVLDVLAVGDRSWRSYLCPDPGCCPAEGHPLTQVTSSAAAACMVAAGRVLAADEGALIADVEVPDRMLSADLTLSGAEQQGISGRASDVSNAEVEAAEIESMGGKRLDSRDAAAALQRWRVLLGTAEPDGVQSIGWLGRALQDRWLRDAVLLTLVPDSGTAPEELLAGADDAALEGMFDRRPDLDLLERGRALLAAVVRVVPPGERVDALALLAWMSWWSGDGPRGRLLASRALADQPGHRLAQLVDSLLRLGVAPDWVRQPPSPGGRTGPI
jgi:hypothetical protein